MSKLDELEAMQVAMKLVSERVRQIQEEGFDPPDDNYYMKGELAVAASIYAMPRDNRVHTNIYNEWPWDEVWFKPTPDDRVKELVKAGALIIAEIQRLWRANHRAWLEEWEDIPGYEGRYQRNGHGIRSMTPWKKGAMMVIQYSKYGVPTVKLSNKRGVRSQFRLQDLLKK